MKKIIFGLMAISMLLILHPSTVRSETVASKEVKISNKAAEAAEAKNLLLRLEVIEKMDKSDMAFAEKRELRKEVQSIKNKLKTLDGGVYLSVGAIIIILLLIILL